MLIRKAQKTRTVRAVWRYIKMEKYRDDLRNVAVIAHVDHGKTTLVDAMLRQSGLLERVSDDIDRVLDSNDLERERGITILAKNTSVNYGGIKINILDTPGHHDFGGEVERMLVMADGVLLLVDAAEGPLPQTRFVLKKALKLNLPIVTLINKIDRKDARPKEVLSMVYDLFIDIGADEKVIDFPVLYSNGRAGIAHRELNDGSKNLKPLFETLQNTVLPYRDRSDRPLLIHVNNLGWDDYVGRLAIGKILEGTLRKGQIVFLPGEKGRVQKGKILKIFMADGLKRVEEDVARSGDIVSLAGIADISIGDTITDSETTPPLSGIEVDEPTLAMNFWANNGPFAGEDGKYITSRNLRDRLFKEEKINVAIKVLETDSTDVFRVIGRGELQMGILIETMRREGYELMISRPEVVTRTIDGKLYEPLEHLQIDIDKESLGAVTQMLGERKAKVLDISTPDKRVTVICNIPARGLIGFFSEFLTETHGTGVLNSSFESWTPWLGDISERRTGALIADRIGTATPYALFHMQPRGILFITPGTRVYEGMVIGETPSGKQINVNITKEKKLTNIRAAAKDDNVILSRPKTLSLEQCMEFINSDELIEVTPKYIRIRKLILGANQRHKIR